MYAAVVLLVGRIIRGIITSGPLDVIINEIPNPDYLLKICLDIYLVREAHDFILEQVWNMSLKHFVGFTLVFL